MIPVSKLCRMQRFPHQFPILKRQTIPVDHAGFALLKRFCINRLLQ